LNPTVCYKTKPLDTSVSRSLFCVSTIPSSNIFSKSVINGVPRACYARLCDTQFLQRRKARHSITIQNGLGFAKLFSGKGFAKPRLMFLKFGGILNSPRAEAGSGRESARDLVFYFGELHKIKKITISKLWILIF